MKVNCVLDTGATRGAISLNLAHKLDLYVDNYQGYSFVQFSGGVGRPDGRVYVDVKLGQKAASFYLMVINNLPVDCILGAKELCRFRVHIYISRTGLRAYVQDDPYSPLKRLHGATLTKIAANACRYSGCAAETIQIAGHHRQTVPYKLSAPLDPKLSYLVELHFLVSAESALIAVDRIIKGDSMLTVEIDNVSNRTINISQGMQIVTVSPVPDNHIVADKTFASIEVTKLEPSETYLHLNKDPEIKVLIDDDLALEEREQLREALLPYKQLFDPTRLGRTSKLTHKIDTGSAAPVKSHPYPVSHSEREIIDDLIKKYLEKGYIVRGHSNWTSPIILVKKPDGSVRTCVDYRKLNKVSIVNNFPLPRIQDLLSALAFLQY